jgi:hypothetical protein
MPANMLREVVLDLREGVRRDRHVAQTGIELTDLAGFVLLVPQPLRDDRGPFTRTVDAKIFDGCIGTPGTFAQGSQSRSMLV